MSYVERNWDCKLGNNGEGTVRILVAEKGGLRLQEYAALITISKRIDEQGAPCWMSYNTIGEESMQSRSVGITSCGRKTSIRLAQPSSRLCEADRSLHQADLINRDLASLVNKARNTYGIPKVGN